MFQRRKHIDRKYKFVRQEMYIYAEKHKAKLLATVTTVKYKFYSGAPCLVRPEASPYAQGIFLVTVVPTLVTEAQELSVQS